ncbi:MAG: histidine phosphatase family protein [Acidobacteriota bacterium]
MSEKHWRRVFLVRHGQVAANREFRYVGARDEPLTELGEEQAAALGRSLGPLSLARVVSSPLLRTRQTADEIANAAGIEVEIDERLREQSFGDWEGLTRGEVAESSDANRELLKRFDRDPSVAPPRGEALADVQRRATEAVTEAIAEGEGSVVVVAHVGPIKALLASAMRLELPQVRPFFLDPATVTVIDWGQPSFLRLFNSPATVAWEQVRWVSSADPVLPGPKPS